MMSMLPPYFTEKDQIRRTNTCLQFDSSCNQQWFALSLHHRSVMWAAFTYEKCAHM